MGLNFAEADIPSVDVAKGVFIPKLSSQTLPVAVAALGALVMPYNIYFSSAIVNARPRGADSSQAKRTLLKYCEYPLCAPGDARLWPVCMVHHTASQSQVCGMDLLLLHSIACMEPFLPCVHVPCMKPGAWCLPHAVRLENFLVLVMAFVINLFVVCVFADAFYGTGEQVCWCGRHGHSGHLLVLQ